MAFSAHETTAQTPANIYCLSLDTRRALQLTNDVKTVDRFPRWSPSGQWVAFQRQFLDEPELTRRVYVVNVGSGHCAPLLIAPEGDSDIERFIWSPDSSSLVVKQGVQGRIRLSVIRLEDRSTAWSYESETVQGGVFSPQGDRILGICADELLWFAYPEGTLLQRLPLAPLSPVRFYFTSAQVGFDLRATAVYFLGTNSRLYRWSIGGICECILEDDPPVRPAYTREEYRVLARDGRPVPVQRFVPPQPRSLAILYVHGGPGAVIDSDDPFMLRLIAEGFEFVCAAYRGSGADTVINMPMRIMGSMAGPMSGISSRRASTGRSGLAKTGRSLWPAAVMAAS